MSTLLRTFREKHSIIGNNTNLIAVQVSKAGNQSLSIPFLELLEFGAIEQAAEHLVHIQMLLVIDGDDAVQVVGGEERGVGADSRVRVLFEVRFDAEIGDDTTANLEGVTLVVGQVVTDT